MNPAAAAAAGRTARFLALAVPLALLGGAYIGQYGFGLYPCEMCWWQRYAHFAALAAALAAAARPPGRGATLLAGAAIAVSGLIGAFHAGVEYHWWQGFTACTAIPVVGGADALKAILAAPLVRCDEVQWQLFGISLAGFNFLISFPAGVLVMWLAARAGKDGA